MDLINLKQEINTLDSHLSNRKIKLDPYGYFIIKIKHDKGLIIVEYFTNTINKNGIAINPDTGEPLRCDSQNKRLPNQIFSGKSAKSLGIQISEINSKTFVSKIDHALYLGRELQKAEYALREGIEYVQD
tara:strand:+ start:1921 stop:2310 length:390 start_codon:yes stop_codon:yes gene_type:complete